MSTMKTGDGFECPECGGHSYGENDNGSVWCWQRGCGWAGSKSAAGMEPPVTFTETQFRKFVRTVYDEGVCDGKINGARQSADELWPLSKSKDYMERLIEIDCPKGEAT